MMFKISSGMFHQEKSHAFSFLSVKTEEEYAIYYYCLKCREYEMWRSHSADSSELACD